MSLVAAAAESQHPLCLDLILPWYPLSMPTPGWFWVLVLLLLIAILLIVNGNLHF